MIRHAHPRTLRLFLAIALLCAGACAGALPAASSPLDTLAPGEWFEAPNSHLDVVKPNPLPPGSSGIASVINAWSGAAFDTKRNRLIVWGGGHGDYAGNEIYTFDIATLAWSRPWGPTPNALITPITDGNEAYLDGNPASRHTYGELEYLPDQDQFIIHNGGLWSPGWSSKACWVFDWTANAWTRKADCLEAGHAQNSYDPVTKHLFVQQNHELDEYDPVANTWTKRATIGAGVWKTNNGVIDWDNRQFVLVGENSIVAYNLTTFARSVPATTGDKAMEAVHSPGLAYDPTSKKIVAWNGGTDVYTLDTATWVWTRIAAAASNTVTPSAATANGMYGRWRYIPSKNCFITVTAVNQNVYFYKLSAGSGVPANLAPVIDSAAWANPAPVVGASSTTVNVTAHDPDSAPAALIYTWSKVSGPGTVVFSPNGTGAAANATATFSASGTYTLAVAVSDGSDTTTSTLTGLSVTLPAPPTITLAPAGQTVTAGDPVSFSVTAVGSGPITYQWKKDGSNISGAISATYAIATSVLTDAGSYSVAVSNAYGSTTSAAAVLTVNPPASGTNPITLSVTMVTLTAPPGSSTPVSTTLALTNTSGGTITVTGSTSAGWLASGSPVTLASGASGGLTLIANPTGLSGTHTAILTLSNSTGETQTITVELTMAGGTGPGAAGLKRGGCALTAAGAAPETLLLFTLAGFGLGLGLLRRFSRNNWNIK